MKQQDKELLLKDLCARLPYGVKVGITYSKDSGSSLRDRICTKEIDILNVDIVWLFQQSEIYIKPYLFPLSSMTEEQTKEVHNLIYQGISESIDETKEWLKTRKENDLRPITLTYILSYKLVIDWFCKNHFDYRDLIPKDLANDASKLNIY